MKLRRLWLESYRNLQQVEICFPELQGMGPALAGLPVHLLVGVNGTGKTNILRAMAHIFSCLEYHQAPDFAFAVDYEISRGGERYEVMVTGDGRGDLGGVSFQVGDDSGKSQSLEPTDWASYLPTRTIVYTSGNLDSWQHVFAAAEEEQGRRLQDQSEALRQQQTAGRSLPELSGLRDMIDVLPTAQIMEEVIAPRTLLFTSQHVALALLATLAIEEDANEALKDPAQQRRDIYRRAAIDRLTRFAVRLEPLALHSTGMQILEYVELLVKDLLKDRLEEDQALQRRIEDLLKRPTPVLPEKPAERIRELAELASHRHRNPDGSYHLLFEMDDQTRLRLSGSQGLFATPQQFFDFFVELKDRGVLVQVDLVLQKTDLAEEILSKHLSDGEFEFLGRMALFLLLHQPESLFLLDEPETHFNDVWKRELVDILANVLEGRESTVLLSTHSSIVVSDIAHPQLVLLVKDSEGYTEVVDVHTPTYGADPSEIMINVLDAPDSIPRRALERLDALLQREWRIEDKDELEHLIRTIGPGYHRSELRSIWLGLNAPQD